MMAFGAIKAVTDLGYRVPEDVSIVGFDDVSMAQFSTPPLTTIRQDPYQKGRVAAKTLLTLIRNRNEADASFKQIIIDTSLVIRSSTGSAKVRSVNIKKEAESDQ